MRAQGSPAYLPSPSFAPTLLLLIAAACGFSLPLFAQSQIQLAGPAALQSDRVTSAIQGQLRSQLSGHRPAWTASAADLGTIADSTPLQLVFGLSRAPEVQAAFDQLTADQQNPASPRYHQWLTPQQVGTLYGPSQHDLDTLTAWLTAQGFTIDLIQPNRVFIQVSAPAAVVSAALQTSLHTYARSSGNLRAPATEPSLPAALAPIVQFIGGLTDVPMHTHLHMAPAVLNSQTNIHPPSAATEQAATQPRPDMALGGGTNFITPADFAVLYDLSPAYTAGVKGTGQKVMIIGGSRLNPPDLSYWESDTNLPSYTPNYIVGSSFTDPGQTNDGNMAEGTLDFERVYGTAPSATVDQVIAANWLSGTVNFNLISYAINTVNDPILTMSFSACEVEEPTGFVQQESSLFQQAASQGISVFASSGDSGVDACEPQGGAAQAAQVASISDICASPYVTCIGGTQFNDTPAATYWSSSNSTGYLSALSYIPEGGWNEPYNYNSSGTLVGYVVSASGGGFSTIIPKPAWQTGPGVPADGARDVPDVSFSASGHNAYFSCLAYSGASCVPNSSGQFYLTGFSGTSASAPSMAGIAALLNQKLGARQGYLNPLLYRMFSTNPNAFHDATIASSGVIGCVATTPSTCNNSNPSPTSLTGGINGYLLQTGFDEVTGLGSLDVANFLNAASAVKSTTVSFTLTPTAASLSLASANSASGTNTITVATTSGFAGPVAFTCTLALSTGTATVNPGCTASPTTVNFPGAATTTVTLTTIAPHLQPGHSASLGSEDFGLGRGAVAFAALFGLCLVGRRRRQRWYALAATLLLAGSLFGLSGCGGSGGGGSTGPTGGTTTGTYTVTITGTSTTGAIPVATTTFNLTVN